jgi:hypothetical protein
MKVLLYIENDAYNLVSLFASFFEKYKVTSKEFYNPEKYGFDTVFRVTVWYSLAFIECVDEHNGSCGYLVIVDEDVSYEDILMFALENEDKAELTVRE